MSETPREQCGIFGIYNHPEAAKIVYLGLYALQHRGQESAGIVSSDGDRLYAHKGLGLVADVFDKNSLDSLLGKSAIGHVRYSTTGSNVITNSQPIKINYKGGELAVAHNGNITNSEELKLELEERGAIFSSTMDSEILIHLIAQSTAKSFIDSLTTSLFRLKGAYSFLIMRKDRVIGMRDPKGFRPLCLGKYNDAYLLASETCAFDIIGAQHIREVEPGEIIIISDSGIESIKPFAPTETSFCVFEYIYYSRPDSLVGNTNVHNIRTALGAKLAEEQPANADIVIPVPDSSNAAAIGYSRKSGIPFEMGLIRSHYVGRTFIEPEQSIRHFGARIKYNPVKSVLNGKRVVVVDDSIVRGTTSPKIVKMIKNAGAKEVHLRISSPPWRFPCYFGIDTPSKMELIGSTHSIEEICKHSGADSLGYLSIQGLKEVIPGFQNYCFACFDGEYPGGKPKKLFKEILEQKY